MAGPQAFGPCPICRQVLIELIDAPGQAVETHGELPALVTGKVAHGADGAVFHLVVDAAVHRPQIFPQLRLFAQRLGRAVNDEENGGDGHHHFYMSETMGYICVDIDERTRRPYCLYHNSNIFNVLGIPFSDPMADGIVIQNAAAQALHNGMSLKLLFEQLRDIRKDVKIPLILMGYLNPIMQFGFENFCRRCVECGIDGVIIPDLPFRDYQEHYRIIAERYNIRVIMLITPETSEERVREIDTHTDGFIYMVSSAATTGAQQDFNEQKRAYFKKIEGMHLNNPLMVGFGISNKATFQAACEHASGAIIGSKFVTLLEEEKDPEKAITRLKEALK